MSGSPVNHAPLSGAVQMKARLRERHRARGRMDTARHHCAGTESRPNPLPTTLRTGADRARAVLARVGR